MDYYIGRENGHYIIAHADNGKPAIERFQSIDPVVQRLEAADESGDRYLYGIPESFGKYDLLTIEDRLQFQPENITTARAIEEAHRRAPVSSGMFRSHARD